MKTDKQIIKLITFFRVSEEWLKSNNQDSKLANAIKLVRKRNTDAIDRYNELLSDILLDNCSIDTKTKVILKDNNGDLCFTVEAQKKVNKERIDLLKQEVEVEVKHVEASEFTDAESAAVKGDLAEAFSGFVIPDIDEGGF